MTTKALAQKIAKDLFTDGMGRHAQRLVMEIEGVTNGSGWSEAAVANVIKKHLDEQAKKQALLK